MLRWRLEDAEGEGHLLTSRDYLVHRRGDKRRLPGQWIFTLSTIDIRNRCLSRRRDVTLLLLLLLVGQQLLLALTVLLCLRARANESTTFRI